MTFSDLALIVVCGLAGPALAGARGRLFPVVVGEIAAGVVVGASGTGWLDATQPTTRFLGEIGFAMLMFVVGTRLPLRAPARVAARCAPARPRPQPTPSSRVPVALLLAHCHRDRRTRAMFVVLLATGSAAIAVPDRSRSARWTAPTCCALIGWVVVADVATIVADARGAGHRAPSCG